MLSCNSVHWLLVRIIPFSRSCILFSAAFSSNPNISSACFASLLLMSKMASCSACSSEFRFFTDSLAYLLQTFVIRTWSAYFYYYYYHNHHHHHHHYYHHRRRRRRHCDKFGKSLSSLNSLGHYYYFTQKQVFGPRTAKSQPICIKLCIHLLLYGIYTCRPT